MAAVRTTTADHVRRLTDETTDPKGLLWLPTDCSARSTHPFDVGVRG
jgi:hypothetical protein